MPATKYDVEITAYASKFAQEFARAASAATGSANKVIGAARGIQGAFAALGVGVSLVGLTAFVKGSIDAADKLNDLSKITGVAATTIGGIGFAAQQAGGDLDGAAKAFGKLNKYIAEALGGDKEAVATFKALGLEIADLKRLTNDEILGRLADEFASFEDGATKSALAQKIFSKSYESILPLLDEGAASLKRNVDFYKRYSGVTEELVQKSDEFNDTLEKLRLISGSFGKELAAALLPSLQALADYLLAARENGDGFKSSAGGVVDAIKLLAKVAVATSYAFKDLGSTLGAVFAQLSAIGRGDFSAVSRIGNDLNERLAESKRQLLDIRKLINDPSLASGGVDASTLGDKLGLSPKARKRDAPVIPGGGGGKAKKEADEYAKALEKVSQELATANEEYKALFSGEVLTKAQKDLARLQASDEWQKLTGPQQADITRRYEAVSAIERETDAQKKAIEEQKKQVEAYDDAREAYERLVASMRERITDYGFDTDAMQREIALIGQDDTARQKLAETIRFEAMERELNKLGMTAEIEELRAGLEKRKRLIDELAARIKQFNESERMKGIFSDAFADEFAQVIDGTKSLSDAFRDMEKSIVASISRIAAQNIAEAIFGKAGVSGGGFLESIIGSLAKSFGGGFASGGDPPVGKVSLVGEKGPELFVPRTAGTIVPAGKFGGNVIHLNVNVPAGTSRATADQIALTTGVAVRRAVARIG